VCRAWLKTHEKYKELKETLRKRETEGLPRSSRSTDRDRDRDRDRERRRDSDSTRDRERDRQVPDSSMIAAAEFAVRTIGIIPPRLRKAVMQLTAMMLGSPHTNSGNGHNARDQSAFCCRHRPDDRHRPAGRRERSRSRERSRGHDRR
jgi:hypothetical protein